MAEVPAVANEDANGLQNLPPKVSRLRRAFLAVAGMLLAIGLGEIAVRVAGLAPQIRPIVLSDESCVYQRSSNPLLGFELKANYRSDQPALNWSYARTNAHGQRDIERQVSKRPGTKRVIMLGDSVVEGWGLDRIDDLISRQLEQLYPAGDVEVLNFGVSGYCTASEVELLATKGLQFEPDVVLLVFVENDFENFSKGEFLLTGEQVERSALIKSLFMGSELFRLSCVQFDWFGFGQEVDPVSWHQQAIGDNNVVDGLKRLAELSREHGFEPFIVIWPSFEDHQLIERPVFPGSETLVIANLADRYGIAAVSIADAFREHMRSQPGQVNPRLRYSYAGDRIHPTVEAAGIAAAAIKRILDDPPRAGKPMIGQAGDGIAEAQRLGASLQPDQAMYYVNLGNAHQRQGRVEQAIIEYQQALRIDPDSAVAENSLGAAYQLSDRSTKAVVHFLRALALRGGYAEAHYNLAVAYASQAQHEKAVQHFVEVLETHSDRADLHISLGRSQLSLRSYPRAEASFRRALTIDPASASASQGLGVALSRQGRDAEAEGYLRKAQRLRQGGGKD